jgi:hemerythrin-like metal-binding protein
MTLLDWNPDWATGVEEIDQQHRAWFDQIEVLMEAIHLDEATLRIPGLLAFLAKYVEAHFRGEEAQMEASSYPDLDAHRAIHNDMRDKVAQLVRQFETDPTSVTEAVLDFQTDWLIDHINQEDRRMAHHLIQWALKHPTQHG